MRAIMIVKPFRGLRPRPDLSDKIPSLPYDVMSSDEARRIAAGDPYSFLHVVRPEIDLDPSVDVHDDRVYARAGENFRAMIDRGWLVRDERPSYYVYRLEMGGHVQTGVVGAASVADYRAERIKKHEHTRPEKEDDRVRLNAAISAYPGPIFLTYRAHAALDRVIETIAAGPPAVSFNADDGVRHTLWPVDDPALTGQIEAAFSAIPATYVADGHHRTAAAARVADMRGANLGAATGEEPQHYFLAVHFPADQLRVLDYNRVVRDLAGMTPAQVTERLRAAGFSVERDHGERRPPRPGTFGMYLDGCWHLLAAPADAVASTDAVERLDVSILQRLVLSPLFDIGDPRTDARIDFVGGIRGMDELEKRVDSGAGAVAFALYPTRLDDVMRVADAGRVMPPKSTWFEPKLRSGMVVQTLDGDRL
jgi:uncharacterized protein (DUF1015 family)